MVKEFFCGLLFVCGVVAVLVPEARESDSGIVVAENLDDFLTKNNTLTPKTIGQTATQIEMAAVGQAITDQLDTPNASDMTIWYEGEPYKDGDAIPDIIEINTKREIVEPEVDTPHNDFDRNETEALTDEKTYTSFEIYIARIILMVIAGAGVWMVTRFLLSAAHGLISDATQITITQIVITVTVVGPLCFYFDTLWIFTGWSLLLIGRITNTHILGPRPGSITTRPLDMLRDETVIRNSYRASGQSSSQVIDTMRRSSLEPEGPRETTFAASSSNTPRRNITASQQSDAGPKTSRMVTAAEKQHRKINLD
ncbi:hypothetical protein [Vibrio sp. 10N.239.312.D08]|uniref:hypothetical protein n=1 Tax=Vibrio sp. 10N.239.312.D08 TaxID=3229978 RepID=UPI003553CCD3